MTTTVTSLPRANAAAAQLLYEDMEARIRVTGNHLYERIRDERPSLFTSHFWVGKILDWAMRDEAFKVAMFRFVDVFPTLRSSQEIARHAREYFGEGDQRLAGALQWGLEMLSPSKLGSKLLAAAVGSNIESMAQQFILASDIRKALPTVRKLRNSGLGVTLTLLGETVISEREADEYVERNLKVLDAFAKEQGRWKALRDGVGGLDWGWAPRINVSVKPSALHSQMKPRSMERSVAAAAERLRLIARKSIEIGAFVNLDMEHRALKNLTLSLYRAVFEEDEFRGYPHTGAAIQAYLKESADDVEEMIEWSARVGHPMTIRLVKGAYWDAETVWARQKNWPVPVFQKKSETDAHFERLARRILEAHEHVTLACGSHNIRSIAAVVEQARMLKVPDNRLEFQILFGMAEPVRSALLAENLPVRIYAPVGEMIPGMAYLVRRLLENTSNESFLRQRFVQGVSTEELLRNPDIQGEEASMTNEAADLFRNTPPIDWTLKEERINFQGALEQVRGEFPIEIPLIVEDWRSPGVDTRDSVNPNRKSEVVAKIAMGNRGDANRAVRAAQSAFEDWSERAPAERVQFLFRAAEIARGRRHKLAALQVYEVGKSWAEADGDVCETIDFLEYYGREMLRLAEPRKMGDAPGEDSRLSYEPRGVAGVIAPWNFPLAISTGMTSAALVTGNTVVYKPSSESAAIGLGMFEIFQRAGLPKGVLNFLPGPGSEVGDFLVTHPAVATIAFTGSKQVGLQILQKAAAQAEAAGQVKKVIAEMGGKNAIILDGDADLDEAIKEVLHSAFGYQGQKCSACSRLIVLEETYDRVVERLREGAESLTLGPVDDPHSVMGAVVSESAQKKIEEYIEIGKQEGELLVERQFENASQGFYAPLAIFTGIEPRHRLAQEEIFGPVLAVMKVKDFGQAIEVANSTAYALTGGVFSRSPANIAEARKKFRVGNLYINRGCTGAIVGRHPFGGFRMSGVGSKAGGPDYLQQFMVPRAIVENTIRRGFAPETP